MEPGKPISKAWKRLEKWKPARLTQNMNKARPVARNACQAERQYCDQQLLDNGRPAQRRRQARKVAKSEQDPDGVQARSATVSMPGAGPGDARRPPMPARPRCPDAGGKDAGKVTPPARKQSRENCENIGLDPERKAVI